MEYNRTHKLPEGVGKKIVEALKKQTNSFDEQFDNVIDSNHSSYKEVFPTTANFEAGYVSTAYDENETYQTEEEWETDSEFEDYEEVETENDEYIYTTSNDSNFDTNSLEPEYDEFCLNDEESVQEEYVPQDTYRYNKPLLKRKEREIYTAPKEEIHYQQPQFKAHPSAQKKQRPHSVESEKSKMPANNIETLTRLVNQLPAGVTRQTGAQIIRQTMEAMGISMNKVLGEAQHSQDEYTQRIKEHINSIEEYKNNIRQLEKDVQKNKKRVDELEDIISLFILTEKERRK
ncbi:MAG: hypothetical protein WCK67_06155 [bacterium]